MAEGFLAAELETIVAATEEIPRAYAHAKSLEAEAKTVREDAVENQALAFEAASDVLRDKHEAGLLSPLETIRAITKLRDLDPSIVSLYHGKHGHKIVQAFEALQPDTPVIGLRGGNFSYTGIVTAQPAVAQVSFNKKSRSPNTYQPTMSPNGKIAVPLRTILRAQEEPQEIVAEVEPQSLLQCVIGRLAIQASVQNATFATRRVRDAHSSITISNVQGLKSFKSHIEELQQLGMKPVTTDTLDTAIEQAERFTAAQRRRSAQSRTYRRRARYPAR